MKLIIPFILLISLGWTSLQAQTSRLNHQSEFWGSLIYPVQLNAKFSIWNDLHYVPNSFFITRHGITFHLNEWSALTGGYAWLKTATPFTGNLIRNEHRPWGQLEFIKALDHRIDCRFRIRYDYRIRRRLGELEVFDDFIQYSRLRFMNGIRFPVMRLKNQRTINLNLMNETLLSFGKAASSNNLGQNRLWFLFGYRVEGITIMPGYLLRYIPSVQSNSLHHGAAIWIVLDINSLFQKGKN